MKRKEKNKKRERKKRRARKKREIKERRGYCLIFWQKKGGDSGDKQFPRARVFPFTHARITRIYTSTTISPWKNYSRVGSLPFPLQKRISLADFALINGKRATTYSFLLVLSFPLFFFVLKKMKNFSPTFTHGSRSRAKRIN